MTGFNVTLPHKEAILPLLDELDEQAGEVQAVNTVEIRSGLLRGCNTDRMALQQLLAPEGLRGQAGLLLGAGVAAWASLCWLTLPYVGGDPCLPGLMIQDALGLFPDQEALREAVVHTTNFLLWPGAGWVFFALKARRASAIRGERQCVTGDSAS